MKKPLSVLHLASFHGNTGDVLNHLSFRDWFAGLLDRPLEWTNLEIRGYFRRQWEFDHRFIDLANKHDLLVIGGGNFFETWPTRSRSGTSIDLTVDDFHALKSPVFVNSIGVDTEQGISAAARVQLPLLIDYLSTSGRTLLSVRNDGAMDTLRGFVGQENLQKVVDLPDAVFFIPGLRRVDTQHHVIGVNLACDMPDRRFATVERGNLVSAVASAVERFMSRSDDAILRLVPHMYSDFSILSELLEKLPDEIRRERVQFLGYTPGIEGAREIADAYAGCSVVVANRFHSAVIPLGLSIPTVGISNYPQLSKLFNDLNLVDFLVDGHDSQNLSRRISDALELADAPASAEHLAATVRTIGERRGSAAVQISHWLNEVLADTKL